MNNPEVEVAIFDTTLRDGAQSLPESSQFPYGEKASIAKLIAGLGVEVIEAGFPATPGDAEEVRDVAKTVGQTPVQVSQWVDSTPQSTVDRYPVIAGLSRTVPNDIEKTWSAVSDAQRPRIHTFVSTDPEHMQAKFPNKSPEDVKNMGVLAVRFAKELVKESSAGTVEFSAEAASTTDLNYLEAVVKSAIDEGADVINLPDTVGQRSPIWMRNFYHTVIGWVHETNPDVVISAHNHNDLGLAVANSLSLVEAAALFAHEHGTTVRTQVESTISGVGERAGNADVFPFVAGLFKFSPDLPVPITWEFNQRASVSVARRVMGFAGIKIDRQNPIIGEDINVHRSGIHSDGVIKGGHTIYTSFNPLDWGHAQSERHEEGRYQGRAGRAAAQAEA